MNDNLPPLPEPSHRCENADDATHFTKLQMREYGKLCRCQAIKDVIAIIPGGDSFSLQRLVDEIRSMK